MSVFDEITAIIQEVKDIPAESIHPETLIREELGADSLDILMMLSAIEEKYSILISDEAAQNLKTIQDAVDYIMKNK